MSNLRKVERGHSPLGKLEGYKDSRCPYPGWREIPACRPKNTGGNISL